MQISVDTSQAIEMGPVDAGEYKVQVLNATYKQADPSAENQWKGISLMLDLPDEVSADVFNHMVWIPDESNQEPKRFARTMSDFKKFKAAFGFAETEVFTVEDLKGKTAWAYLTVKDDSEYGPQNRIQRWISGPASGAVEY